MRHEELIHFINERIRVYQRRADGQRPPWTKDAALRSYRFTNVYREWDPVSIFINKWLLQAYNPRTVVARTTLARYLNEPAALQHLGTCEPWEPENTLDLLQRWRASGKRVFNPAYIVSTNGVKMDKLLFVIDLVNHAFKEAEVVSSDTLEEAAETLMYVRGIGSFMAGQIVADLKHTPLLAHAADWMTWCTPGPGSRRGLDKVLRRHVPHAYFHKEARQLYTDIQSKLELPKPLDMQNFQNCLCEFDKWCRVIDGNGRPKQLYRPV